jgi:hypothetical protein
MHISVVKTSTAPKNTGTNIKINDDMLFCRHELRIHTMHEQAIMVCTASVWVTLQ